MERFRRHLRDWRLCKRDSRGGKGPGWYFSVNLGSAMSNTVGGRVLRSSAAASGKAASICSRASGRAARGSSGYTIPVLCKFHPRKFHPRKFHHENSTHGKFHPRKFHPRKFHPWKIQPTKISPMENSTHKNFTHYYIIMKL